MDNLQKYRELIADEKAFLDGLPKGELSDDECEKLQIILDEIRASRTAEDAVAIKLNKQEVRKNTSRMILKKVIDTATPYSNSLVTIDGGHGL